MDGASSSSSAAQNVKWLRDVFISFRGEDTRNNFVDHLYAALNQAGICTFKDDEKLRRGKSISPELMQAIQESMVAVVVFSKNYANSSWCLEELVKIIECRDLTGQVVLPVFYDVEPSDVRDQKGSFHVAFEQHEVKLKDDLEKVRRWRETLMIAANLSGWDVPKTASGREAECIKQIVRTISGYTRSHPSENLVGMEIRIQDVKSLLGKGSDDDVRIIGIWGMGGIGKTTIARAVYHQIAYDFDGCSFLNDVREYGFNNKGLKSLQEKLLSEILKETHFKVKDCDDGKLKIRRRLRCKKVFVVLDDVDNFRQLEFLAGAREWFGPGSRIIVTTRDEHLLCCAQKKYSPELLQETEAMRLFSRYAFNANIPPKGYEELSSVVVRRTGHLPLALKVLGSHFCGRDFNFWESGLKALVKVPHKEIIEILKLSFNGLNPLEQKIFLYIACFYKGWERLVVTRILDSCGFEVASGITVLIEKSILTISGGYLNMHDLIQEMGRCIVCECYPNTMLWIPEKVKEVMKIFSSPFLMFYSNLLCFGPPSFVSETETDFKRLDTVEAIVEPQNHAYGFSATLFNRMKNLKLLQVRGRFIATQPRNFPQELRWLDWFEYPFNSLRLSGMTNLVGLQMLCGRINQLQVEQKVSLINLKFMDLSGSRDLRSFPDISGVPNLESLNLSRCSRLVEVHQSVLHHEKIIHLDLSSCGRLNTLPPSIQMKSLQALDLHGCTNLKRFPEVSMEMGRLLLLNIPNSTLILSDIRVRLLTGLIVFVSSGSYDMGTPPKIQWIHHAYTHLSCLRILDLKGNNLVRDDFPSDVHNSWPSLEELDLSENLFTLLPACISHLPRLKYLNLNSCTKLEELHELPSCIQVLKADHCTSLILLGDLSKKYKWLFKISLRGCPKLLNNHENECHLSYMLMKSLVQKCGAVNHQLSITIPGSKIPPWFSNRRSGNKISLDLPQNQVPYIRGLAVCCLFIQSLDRVPIPLKIEFRAPGVNKLIDMPTTHTASTGNYVWIVYMSTEFLGNLFHGFEIEDFIIGVESGLNEVFECGVCAIYKDDIVPITGMGSWFPDYDESVKIDRYSASSEDLQHGRWSEPTFSYKTTGGHKDVKVLI